MRALASPPAGLPRRFVEQALSLAPDLVRDEGVDARLVHTDLHYANVLAGQRQPWLAIDPKPLAAEPAYAVAPALWNRWDEAVAAPTRAGPCAGGCRSSASTAASTRTAPGPGRSSARCRTRCEAGSGREAAARVTVAVTILKAMND